MIILGLGSNIGNREANLQNAVNKLAGIVRELRFSRVFESPALMPEGAPKDWNKPFFNMAVAGMTGLSPKDMLHAVKSMEQELGRKQGDRWCPRVIDIDILAMDNTVLETPELCVPHRELLNRDFALLPLVDVAPDWCWPVEDEYLGKRAAEIAKAKGYALPHTEIRIHG